MPKKPPTLPTTTPPPIMGGKVNAAGVTIDSSAGEKAICVCERTHAGSATVAEPAGELLRTGSQTFARTPQAEARRILAEELPSHLTTQPESPPNVEASIAQTPMGDLLASPEHVVRAREIQVDEDGPCREKALPCLNPEFLEDPGYIADQRPPRKGPEFVGDEQACDPAAPDGRQIDDEVKKLSTMGESSERTEQGKRAAQEVRKEAARNLGRWAREFPEVAERIKREVISWKHSDKNKFHNEGPELKRLEKWAKETSAVETSRVESDFEMAQTGPVLGELGLLLAVDPAELKGRQTLEAKAEQLQSTATVKELKDAILHLRKRLDQLSARDPEGKGKDPRRVCVRGVRTTYDAELVRDFIKKMLKELLNRLQSEAIKARTMKPKDLTKFPFSFEDLRNPGISEKILEFRDFLDFANGGYEDLLGLDSAASGLIDAIENSGLEVEDSWTDQEIAKDIFKRLQDLRR